VLVAIAACASLGELSSLSAWGAVTLVAVGTCFSYVTRVHPPGWIKLLLAVSAVAAVVWFFHHVSSGPISDITSVEDPLTVLFVCILVVHSFHVPSARDLMFSLGASAGLMAVGAAQAIDLHFGGYALAWVGFCLWGLTELWRSASGGGRVSITGLGATVVGVTLVAALPFLLLPAPSVAVRINFLARPGNAGSVAVPGALAGDAGSPAELSRAGTPSGPTRVGGYLGFANSLDTALRGQLSHTVVMLVRAQRPSYFVGETFNSWDGENWSTTKQTTAAIDDGSPFSLPLPEGDDANGQTDLQTFYIKTSTADLVFHAEGAAELWFPASTVFYSSDGTVVSPIGLGSGAVYTVDSRIVTPTAQQLERASGGPPLPAADNEAYTQLPHPYPQAQALAESVTAGATNTYDKVAALIAWIGANTRYSTDIPALPAGADTVNEFLFGNRVGFCEQISTSLAVMLRSLGIPAREAVGYVPGPYNPVTDLYQVEADDAHAWVQVWIPGYGWQNFDPTAAVPAANPSPGATALTDLGHALRQVPVAPVSAVLGAVVVVAAFLRWRRRRPANWAERVARSVERAGRRAGRPRRASETFAEYAANLDMLSGGDTDAWTCLASAVEESVYGGREPPPGTQRDLVDTANRMRLIRRREASGVGS